MKMLKFIPIVLALVAASLLAFTKPIPTGGSVKGTVTPANAALKASVISDSNTFQTNIISGAFEIKDVKPGTYRLVIEASLPFKKEIRDDIQVKEGQTTDVGEIQLKE